MTLYPDNELRDSMFEINRKRSNISSLKGHHTFFGAPITQLSNNRNNRWRQRKGDMVDAFLTDWAYI